MTNDNKDHGRYKPFSHIHSHTHDEEPHNDCCGHHHGHDHHEHSSHMLEKHHHSKLSRFFERSVAWIKDHQRPLIWGASGLLVTTALTPLVPSGIIPLMAVVAGGLYLMNKASDHALVDFESFGQKRNMSAISLGIMTGVIHSASEAVVSFSALSGGSPELALSNIVGGSIVHTLGILGAAAAISGIGDKQSDHIGWKFNTAVMAAGTGALAAQLLGEELIPGVGLGMAGFGLYHLYKRVIGWPKPPPEEGNSGKYKRFQSLEKGASSCGHDHGHRKSLFVLAQPHSDHAHSACGHDHSASSISKKRPVWVDGASAVLSLGALIAVSDVVIQNLMELSDKAGISHTMAGIGIAAIGTALPEAIMTIKAAMKKKTGFALGNVMGCNITNTLLVGGAIGAISGLDNIGFNISEQLRNIPVPSSLRPDNLEGALNWGVFLGSSLLVAGLLSAQDGKIKKWQGLTAAVLYAAYLTTMTQISDKPLLHCHLHADGRMHCANDNTGSGNLELRFDGLIRAPDLDLGY